MIRKPLVAENTFLTVITFSRINFFIEINSIVMQHLQVPFIKIKNLIYIRLKKIVIKIIYHLFVYKITTAAV